MKAQPQILLSTAPTTGRLASCISSLFDVPAANIFDNSFPDDADFDAAFEQGYFLVHAFTGGVFPARLDGFFSSSALSEDNLIRLADCLDMLVCVDRSISESEPHYDGYFRGKKYPYLKVFVEEDSAGDPYYRSDDVEAILQDRFIT